RCASWLPRRQKRQQPAGTVTMAVEQLRSASRARCAWVESDRDCRIREILIQPAGWAEASRNGKAVFSRLARPGDRGGGEGQAEPPGGGPSLRGQRIGGHQVAGAPCTPRLPRGRRAHTPP